MPRFKEDVGKHKKENDKAVIKAGHLLQLNRDKASVSHELNDSVLGCADTAASKNTDPSPSNVINWMRKK